jgi:hypothetical protein
VRTPINGFSIKKDLPIRRSRPEGQLEEIHMMEKKEREDVAFLKIGIFILILNMI